MFSTYAITDSAGAVAERYAYEPYGQLTTYDASYAAPEPTSRLSNPFTFTGRELDAESTLMHYRARAYSSTHGRFLQPDPLEYGGGSIALYQYASGTPVTLTDPTGLQPQGRWVSGSTKTYSIGDSGPVSAWLTRRSQNRETAQLAKEQKDLIDKYTALLGMDGRKGNKCTFEVKEYKNTVKSSQRDVEMIKRTITSEFVSRPGKEGCNVFVYLGHRAFDRNQMKELEKMFQRHTKEGGIGETLKGEELGKYYEIVRDPSFERCDAKPTFGGIMCFAGGVEDIAEKSGFDVLVSGIGDRLLEGPHLSGPAPDPANAQNFLTYGAQLLQQSNKSAEAKCKIHCCDVVRVHVMWGRTPMATPKPSGVGLRAMKSEHALLLYGAPPPLIGSGLKRFASCCVRFVIMGSLGFGVHGCCKNGLINDSATQAVLPPVPHRPIEFIFGDNQNLSAEAMREILRAMYFGDCTIDIFILPESFVLGHGQFDMLRQVKLRDLVYRGPVSRQLMEVLSANQWIQSLRLYGPLEPDVTGFVLSRNVETLALSVDLNDAASVLFVNDLLRSNPGLKSLSLRNLVRPELLTSIDFGAFCGYLEFHSYVPDPDVDWKRIRSGLNSDCVEVLIGVLDLSEM